MRTGAKVIQRLLAMLLLLLGLPGNRAALQFDVFPGFESTIHEAEWFPVTFEIFNDGPSFNGVIQINPAGQPSEQSRRVPIELPTNTRKRLTVPMFASVHRYSTPSWDARLYDSGGKERAKREGMATPIVAWEATLLGAIPKTFGGLPILPESTFKDSNRALDAKPKVGRLQVEQFPDNPIALEGLDALYLNSEKALELREEQVGALLAWVRGGGHLIVGLEQNADVTSTAWLRQFVPMELTGSQNLDLQAPISNWIKDTSQQARTIRQNMEQDDSFYNSMAADPAYKESAVPVATGNVKDAEVVIGGNVPLAVSAVRGRGKVTLLTFSPEREPFRSWKGRGHFWAKLVGIPGAVFSRPSQGIGGYSSDGIFGALIDSRQIKKLPVTWLLILLLVYLVVIGPFDQWWLKKIGKQMLTWITFPAYVVLFSLLIYFIGYKLRAGETEWNELNIVDVFPRGDKVDMRGRTYISIYSSGNARYQLSGQNGFATMRNELIENAGNRDSRLTVQHHGNSFKSEVFVPVWTSLLFVNDWFKTNDTPFLASVSGPIENRSVEIKNLLNVPLKTVRVVVDERLHEVGDIAAGETKTFAATASAGTLLQNFIQHNGSYFQQATDRRRNALGDSGAGHLEDRPLTTSTASFIGYLDNMYAQGQRGFIAPAGLDLSEQAMRGDAIILAFVPNQTFAEDINQFKTPRFQRDTLLRLVLPVKKNAL